MHTYYEGGSHGLTKLIVFPEHNALLSLYFILADRLYHNDQAVLLKWNFLFTPKKDTLAVE